MSQPVAVVGPVTARIRLADLEIREATDRILRKLERVLGVCDECDPVKPCDDCNAKHAPPDPED